MNRTHSTLGLGEPPGARMTELLCNVSFPNSDGWRELQLGDEPGG